MNDRISIAIPGAVVDHLEWRYVARTKAASSGNPSERDMWQRIDRAEVTGQKRRRMVLDLTPAQWIFLALDLFDGTIPDGLHYTAAGRAACRRTRGRVLAAIAKARVTD